MEEYRKELIDRFGEIPNETKDLMDTIKLREIAKKIGFEKLIIKNSKLIGRFTKSNPKYFESTSFSAVLKFIQKNKKGIQLKEKNNQLSLTIDAVSDIEIAIRQLNKIIEN